jgi:hypothetical protein
VILWFLIFCAPCILVLPLFSSEVFVFEPFHFGVAFSSSEVFLFEPLAFWGCLFLHRRPLFLSPLHFWVASFFIGGFCF